MVHKIPRISFLFFTVKPVAPMNLVSFTHFNSQVKYGLSVMASARVCICMSLVCRTAGGGAQARQRAPQPLTPAFKPLISVS